jgi:hypothetical protein
MDNDNLTWLFGIEKFFNFINESEKKKFIRNIINMKYSEASSKPWPLKDLISSDYELYPDSYRSDRLNFYANICAEDKLVTKELIYIMNSIWTDDSVLQKLHKITLLNDSILATIFSKSQILSKLWMAETLSKHNLSFNNILLIGGWLTHHSLFLKDINYKHLYSIDPDVSMNPLINIMNPNAFICNKNIEHCFNGNNDIIFNDSIITPDLVINTSAEHMDNTWFEKLKPGTTVLLQSNSSPDYQHINYCQDFGVFLKKYPVTKLYFRGETVLPSYKRYMLYGVK